MLTLRIYDRNFSLSRKTKITDQALVQRYKLVFLEQKLSLAQRDFAAIDNATQRRRQREKIFRIQAQVDRLKLSLED